jgi:hypothetical protein
LALPPKLDAPSLPSHDGDRGFDPAQKLRLLLGRRPQVV